MRFLTIFLSMFLATQLSHATLNDVDKAALVTQNLLVNPGFENGKASWTASGGTFAIATSGSNLLHGAASATWDSSASSQTLTSTAVTIPRGLYGRPGVVVCNILTPSGTATHTIQAYDGSNILASETVISNTNPVRSMAQFLFPTSGAISVRLVSVASNEPSITIDSCYVGPSEGVLLVNAKTQDVFSAAVSSADAVNQENVDWINGSCTDATTGEQSCVFNSGIFVGSAPNCQVTANGANTSCQVSTVSTSGLTTLCVNDAGTNTDSATFITCQKGGSDSPSVAFKPDTLAQSWSGYFNTSCAWARTNVAQGDFAADASCTLVTNNSRNLTVSKNASDLPGIRFTPSGADTFKVCSSANAIFATTGALYGMFLVDDSTTANEFLKHGDATSHGDQASMCIIVRGTGGVEKNIKWQGLGSSGALTITSNAAAAISWTIEKIDQSIPAPMIANSVVTKSAAVMGIESANLNCDASASINSQNGSWVTSIGNISSGVCVVTINAGVFSSAPFCAVSAASGAIVYTSGLASTSFNLGAVTDAGANSTSFDARVLCVGPR